MKWNTMGLRWHSSEASLQIVLEVNSVVLFTAYVSSESERKAVLDMIHAILERQVRLEPPCTP
jgi:hypothetical protein